jgi:beta-mannosidase
MRSARGGAGAAGAENPAMPSLELNRGWTLSFTHPVTGRPHRIAATVPGNVEIDLVREGLLADPHPTDDLHAMRDWERVDDWTYETAFDAPAAGPDDRVRLVFEGVDTIAEVDLNGAPILRCDNMFVPHEADVTGRLQPAGNVLRVRIHSPALYARQFRYDAFQNPNGRADAAYLRKARHMWGWDNAPRLLSAGLWRPVRLETVPSVRFEDAYLYTHHAGDAEVVLGADWRIATPDADLSAYRGVWRLARDGRVEHELPFDVPFVFGRLRWTLPREAVRLWWPRGYGEPALYDASLTLYRGGAAVAEWRGRFGIRELELRRSEDIDARGEGDFVFVCNGERIYANGTNWKPLDPLHGRSGANVRRALDLCLDLNCNMVRVWGGGVYEDRAFYDYCDGKGLLVWQDFMFACEVPPRDEWFQRAVAREAETIVRRLRNHPSIAVWCGDNEVDASFFWGARNPKGLVPADNVITRQVLPRAVQEFDPYRSYVPSSPHVSDRVARERRAGVRGGAQTGEDHLYPGNESFREAFRASAARFIGETGPFFINAMSQSPDVVALEMPRARRLWDAPIDGRDYTIQFHQLDAHFLTWKDASRRRLRHLFGRDFSFEPWEEFALAINIVCAEIFKFAIEWSRSRKWAKTGVLWWSLVDMWPMMFNYSVVDARFRPKQPCYDWIRRSQQARCLLVAEPAEGDLELFAANDTREPFEGRCRVTAIEAGGGERTLLEEAFTCGANGSERLRALPRPAGQALWMIEWEAGGRRAFNHYIAGSPPFPFEAYHGWVARLEAREREEREGRTSPG